MNPDTNKIIIIEDMSIKKFHQPCAKNKILIDVVTVTWLIFMKTVDIHRQENCL